MISKVLLCLSIGSVIVLEAEPSVSLRAQQSPCYEFLCGSDPNPLCASNGVEYLNGCVYSQAQCKNPSLFVVNPGSCTESDAFIVTSDNPLPANPEIETEIVEVSTVSAPNASGEFETTSQISDPCADPFCSSTYTPVCGNDGITYSNICQFTKAQCRTPGLELKHEGRCKNFENCLTRICPMREDSVCGSDRKLYRNICELSIAKCYDPSLTPIANGPCPPEDTGPVGCEKPCEDQYRPVCATNSQTYPNICHFENAKCRNQKLKIYKFEPC